MLLPNVQVFTNFDCERRGEGNLLLETQIAERESEEIQQSNEQKRRKVHQKIAHVVALGWVCDGQINL